MLLRLDMNSEGLPSVSQCWDEMCVPPLTGCSYTVAWLLSTQDLILGDLYPSGIGALQSCVLLSLRRNGEYL